LQGHEVEVVAVAVPQHHGHRGAAHQSAVEAFEGGADAGPRRDHVVVVEMAVAYSGPLPPPEWLRQYEEVRSSECLTEYGAPLSVGPLCDLNGNAPR